MTTDPRPGMIRFNGAARAYLVTICHQCDMVLPHDNERQRMAWALGHQRTGHRVVFAVEVRPDPAQPFAFVTRETLQQQTNPSWYRPGLVTTSTPDPGPAYPDAAGAGGQWSPPWQHQTWTAGKATLTQVGGGGGGSSEEPKKTTARERRRARRKGLQQSNEPAGRDSAKNDDDAS